MKYEFNTSRINFFRKLPVLVRKASSLHFKSNLDREKAILKRAQDIKHYRKKRRIIIALYAVIVGLLYMFKNESFLIRSLSTIGLLAVFYLTDNLFDVKFKERHYLFIFIIAISSFMLSPLYYISPNYDKIQHFILPILFSSIVFFMINYLDIHLKWKLMFTFFVVIGVIGLHEIGEYFLDYFFGLKLQGVFLRSLRGLEKYNIILDRIDDTMIDMVFGVIGSLTYWGYSYVKNKIKKCKIKINDWAISVIRH